ncbi:hypothetical protein JR316_0001995 [Psilocybe cubensis]|uniref:Uncharacterized protein n=1 Tax=Psilocybe cubensis TaxID=181762 RepID=A0ACB8HAQ8_PSICU|nr:hypothetical protein JR316_0001995 [Psilocybe cubensis]KAH9485088.1 hypothetical protein JR316_0001995 [Psilocybe cubensis]
MQLPYPVTSTRIGKHVGELPRLIEQHDEAVIQLEEVVAKYTNGGKPSSHRPTIIIGGFCGLGGTRVDAIKYYTSKVRRAEGAVQQYRAQLDPKRTENYGFATIATIPLAHAAARELKGEHPKGLTFKLAPNPRDIIWSNIGLSKPSKQFRRTTGFLLMMFFSALSLFPLFPIASLANLDAVSLAASGYIPFLRTWSHSSPISYALVSGLAPPIIAAFFNYFLPRLMRWLSKYMGAPTHTNLARIVIARYFAFLIVSQLIIFTILGVIFHSALEIVEAVQRQGANFKTIIENLDTIGLQNQFKSLQLVASIPPLVILLLFKFYLNRKFANNFQYHLPEHQEFSRAVARSQQSSTSYNLEDRYCHPALKAVLFTPMIHSHALPILRRHYEGKGNENEKILTRGVSKKSQNVKIKGVNNDPIVDGVVFNVVPKYSLEYDPEQYKHDEDNAYYDYDHGAVPSGSRSALELRQPSSRHGNETSSRGVRLYDPGLTVRPIGMLSGDHHESTNRMYDIQAMNLSPALSYQPSDVPSHDVQPSTYQQRHRTRRNDEFTHDGISPGDKSLPPVPPGS